jgi:cytoskeleton protein RodZ
MLIMRSTAPTTSLANNHATGLSQLGSRLHNARIQQELSLREAANTTRILACYLAALEVGAYHRLPSQVCARGFIRIYAEYLDIPAEELIELYHREYGVPKPINIVPAITPIGSHRQWLPSFFGVTFVVLLLASTSYLVLSALN